MSKWRTFMLLSHEPVPWNNQTSIDICLTQGIEVTYHGLSKINYTKYTLGKIWTSINASLLLRVSLKFISNCVYGIIFKFLSNFNPNSPREWNIFFYFNRAPGLVYIKICIISPFCAHCKEMASADDLLATYWTDAAIVCCAKAKDYAVHTDQFGCHFCTSWSSQLSRYLNIAPNWISHSPFFVLLQLNTHWA